MGEKAAGRILARDVLSLGEVAEPRDHLSGIQGQGLIRIVERTPHHGHDAAVALPQGRVSRRRLRVEWTGVEEDDLVPEDAVDPEDVLQGCQEGQVTDRRSELLIHLTHDRIVVSLAEVDAAADEAVIAVGVLFCRWIEGDRVGGEVVVRRHQHRLHPDERPVYRHASRLATGRAVEPG